MLGQPIAEAAFGFDDPGSELLSQPADMDLDRVALDLCVEGIELLLQLRLGQQLAGSREEGLEQRPLAGRQLDELAVAMNASRRQVDLERTMGDDRVRVAAVAPRDRAARSLLRADQHPAHDQPGAVRHRMSGDNAAAPQLSFRITISG